MNMMQYYYIVEDRLDLMVIDIAVYKKAIKYVKTKLSLSVRTG